jgi:hypothetical protein
LETVAKKLEEQKAEIRREKELNEEKERMEM